jgi:bacteriocin biosynthesis cyclodehydratase domain-containing protein
VSEPAVDDARRPALAPWYRVVQQPDRLLLEHGGSLVTLEGGAARRLLPALVPLLDGRRTVAEIAAALGPAAERPVRRAVDLLDAHGLLVDGIGEQPGEGEAPAAESALFVSACSSAALRPAVARRRLAAARVRVVGRAAAGGEIARLLRDTGVGEVRRVALDALPDELELLVVAPAPHETTLASTANERALGLGLAWLQLLPHDGRSVVVGPLFVPGATACHACYRMRRAAASGFEDDFDLVDAQAARAASPAALCAVAAGMAALLAIHWLAAADPSVPGRAYTIATRGVLELTPHRILRVPRCPGCAHAPEALPSPWYKEAARAG